nr:SusC/RagA family TonB-linked outer membrane protein [uncultured Mucilaginibacter sp.]
MKKLLLVSLCVLVLCVTQVFAQNRTITGTVTAKDDGLPIPGATVKIKGTDIGVPTDASGKFSISAPDNAVLLISFVAYTTQEVPVAGKSVVNVTLAADNKLLSEVVVTSLGVTSEKRTLGYAQTTVKNSTINASSPIGLLGGLQGKVAGVTISNVSGSPGGTTKVILRGYSSITGSNQPLYVIDGVPFNNSRLGSDNNYDFGNAANDIDPNMVDNISILKGSAATALYGSRGSKGVILVTTKKGKAGRPVVEFNSGVSLTNVAITYNPQNTFGQGWGGEFILSENGSWGPKLDGVVRPWGATGAGTGASIGNKQLIKPFSAIKNNVADAFDTGVELNNNVQVSGGTDVSQYFISYGNVYSNGVLPGTPDLYRKNNFSIRQSAKFNKFSVDVSLNYANNKRNVVQTGQGTGNADTFYEALLQIPTDVPIKDLRNYKNEFFNVDNYFTPFAFNPFYSLGENGARQTSNRFYGNINLNYKALDWLTINFQQSADISGVYLKTWYAKTRPSAGSWNDGKNVEATPLTPSPGGVTDAANNLFEYDSKLQALVDKKLSSDLNLTGLAGINYNDRGSNGLATSVEDLAIPGFYQINNSLNKPQSAHGYSHKKQLGFYAQATLGFKNYLFLTVGGRNDVSSTLAPGKNSYFYPSSNVAFVLSDALNLKSDVVSYIKLRGSYGETGSDTDPYNIYNTLTATNIPLTFGNLIFPLNNNGNPVAGYTVSNTTFTTNLKPERVRDFEVGGEFRFFNSRVGLDLTYYHRTTEDQLLPAPISPGTGYLATFVNAAKSENRGVEVAFNATPINGDFVWDFTYTFSKDKSKVLALAPGVDRLLLNSTYDAQLVAVPGQPMGIIQAPKPQLDPQGRIIVNAATGMPVQSTDIQTYGAVQPDYRMGMTNNFRYKGLALGFTLDYSKGGVFYSGTADLLGFVGNDPVTTYNDRNPFIIPNSVVATTVGTTTTYTENTFPIEGGHLADYYYQTNNKGYVYQNLILDRTYFKVREVTLSYTLPKFISNKLGASNAKISLYGRNLLTWLPASNQVVDPEVSNLGSDLQSEFGEFRTSPPLKYYGASLKVTF